MLFRHTSLVLLWLILLGVGVYFPGSAQETPADTLQVAPATVVVTEPEEAIEPLNISAEDSVRLPDPRKAAFLSAVLPGMGQVYNGALWKVPLVYAGGAIFINSVNFFNQRYSEYRKNAILMRRDPDYKSPGGITLEQYESAAQQARRSREYFIILGVLYYGIQIVEAHVDAHLQSFNADEELSFKMHPTLIPTPTGNPVAGIRITYTLP